MHGRPGHVRSRADNLPGTDAANLDRVRFNVRAQEISGPSWLDSGPFRRQRRRAGEIELQFALEKTSAATPPSDAPIPPTASPAIQDQLGLRLEAGKEPIPFLVVESAIRKPE